MELGNVVITKPEANNEWKTLQWFIDLLTRILNDVFGFIYDTEWADKAE